MKTLFATTLLSILIFISACNLEVGVDTSVTKETNEKQDTVPKPKKKYTGEKLTHYPNGDIKSRVNFVDGRMHGKAFNYYRGGKVHSEFEYNDGDQEGITRWYYEDGKLYQEIPYKSGQMDGHWKQYFKNGKLQAEQFYKEGDLGLGTKEYATDGKLKKQYPKLVIKERDETVFNNTYTLKLRLTDTPKWVEYYYGTLTDGKYLGPFMTKVPTSNMEGEIAFTIGKGRFMMEKFDIVAKIKTANGLYYLVHKPYNLSVENR